ncbi:MAG: flagellar brake protein [Betaproteobacteria bacterium]|nr:flagellar brake protein [Betaproteobacteria bacterium]
MNTVIEELPVPDFEIDHPDEYAQYFLSNPREISFYLNLLVKRGCLVSAHIDAGQQFFLTAMVAVDEEKGEILIDPAQIETLNTAAGAARQITLAANLDRVKVQLRLGAMRESQFDGRRALSTDIPRTILRLQRREFFRLEPPLGSPIGCQIALNTLGTNVRTFEPRVTDISGGGVSLSAPTNLAEACQPGTVFKDCRLDLPGEGVLLVNLRVRKLVEISANTGIHNLRIGCEFVNLPGTRLAMIERYITRIERERKARDSGLAD